MLGPFGRVCEILLKSNKTNYVPIDSQIGVTDVFDEAKSKLSGMTNPNEPLYVSDAIQKTFIEVNEEGAEAAAANGKDVNGCSTLIKAMWW